MLRCFPNPQESQALTVQKGRVGRANGSAARLGANRTTLLARMKKLAIYAKRMLDLQPSSHTSSTYPWILGSTVLTLSTFVDLDISGLSAPFLKIQRLKASVGFGVRLALLRVGRSNAEDLAD